MIKYTQSPEIIKKYAFDDAFTVRILAMLAAYGTSFSFTRYWVQENTAGAYTALIAALDNHYTLSFTLDADREELASFFNMVGFTSLQCSGLLTLPFSFTEGCVMKKKGGLHPTLHTNTITTDFSLDFVYHLNQDFLSGVNYKDWYADLSRRIRRGTAQAAGILEGQAPAATALLTAKTEKQAIIGYIATKPACRAKGYATALVHYLTQNAAYDYFLLCEKKNHAFYKKLGFNAIGNWRVYHI